MTKWLVEYNFDENNKPQNIKFFSNMWEAAEFVREHTTDGGIVELEEV